MKHETPERRKERESENSTRNQEPGTRNRIQNPELNTKEIRGKSVFAAEVTGPTGHTGYELPVSRHVETHSFMKTIPILR